MVSTPTHMALQPKGESRKMSGGRGCVLWRLGVVSLRGLLGIISPAHGGGWYMDD